MMEDEDSASEFEDVRGLRGTCSAEALKLLHSTLAHSTRDQPAVVCRDETRLVRMRMMAETTRTFDWYWRSCRDS